MYTYTFRKIQNVISFEFSKLFSVVSPLLLVSSTLSVKAPSPFPHFSPHIISILAIPLSSSALQTPWSLFTFLTCSAIPVMCSHLEMRNHKWERTCGVLGVFWVWVASLNTIFLLPTVYLKISFFFRAEWYSIVQMYHILTVQSSAEEHFNCFYFLVFVNRVQWMQPSRYLWSESFGHMPRNGVAESYGRFVFNF